MSLLDTAPTVLANVAAALGPPPQENSEAAAAVKALLNKYELCKQKELQSGARQAGRNMTLPKEILGGEPVASFGHVPGIKPGAKFKDRGQLYISGVHRTLMKGIHAPPAKNTDYARGAYSIVMSGGYVDDEDMGESFWYTGEGGFDTALKQQMKDQSIDRGANAALRNNFDTQTPVRVIRGFVTKVEAADAAAAGSSGASAAHPSPGADGGGGGFKKEKGFVYEGLYAVLQCKQERSKDGPLVCKFLMAGVPGHSTVNTKVEFGIFGGAEARNHLHARRLAAAAPGSRSAVPPAKRQRVDKDRKALEANREAMLAEIRQQYSAQVLLCEDLSGGKENVPIPLINEVSDETLPSDFTYICEYSWAPGLFELVCPILKFADEEMMEFTRFAQNGTCGIKFNRFMGRLDTEMATLPQGYENHLEEQYNPQGCLIVTDPCGLHECGPSCNNAKCRNNKHLSNGITLPLEVFMTNGKGWGVRCREPIPVGAFVTTYVGQLVTDAMAEARKGTDHYLFDLDFFTHIYAEIVEKGLPSIGEELPLHKIPPVPSVSHIRSVQANAAAKARARQQAPTTTAAGPSSGAAAAGPTGAMTRAPETAAATTAHMADGDGICSNGAGPSTWPSPSGRRRFDPDGLLPHEVVPAAARDLLASCCHVQAATVEKSAGAGPSSGAAAAAGGLSSKKQPVAVTPLGERGAARGGAAPSGSAQRAVSGATTTSRGSSLLKAVTEAAKVAAVDPGAFYLTPIISGGGGGGNDARQQQQDPAAAGVSRPAPARCSSALGAGEGTSMPSADGGLADEQEYSPVLVIDARYTGNVGRFINHSCEGNLTIQAVFAGQYRNTLLYHVGLYACRDIAAMEELTYDYGYNKQAGHGGQYGMECRCGAPNCVGQLM